MTRWRMPATSGKRHSILESSGSRSHPMQSPFCPPAPRRSAPGHFGSNPLRTCFRGRRLAWEMRATGSGRFGQISTAMRELRSRLVRDDAAVFPTSGGFAFSELGDGSHLWSDFPSARLVVPQVLIQNDGDGTLLRVTVQVGPRSAPGDVEADRRSVPTRTRVGSNPRFLSLHTGPVSALNRSQSKTWESSVATAVDLIRQGTLDKVVLAREERLLAESAFSPFSTLARLRRFDSAATLFAMQSDSAWFLGASPERLVRLRENRVDVTCLAGSIGMGSDEDERRGWLTGCSPARRTVRSTRSSSARR